MLRLAALSIILTSAHATSSRQACCLQNGVSEYCAQNLCDLKNPPGDVARYSLFDGNKNCTNHLNEIAQCLTAGRDSSQCCETKARDPEESSCFGLCSGEIPSFSSYRDMMSCIALNLPSIYECILEGEPKIPTPPQDLRIENGMLKWRAPQSNAKFVTVYKIYITDNSGTRTRDYIHETSSMRFDLKKVSLGRQYTLFVVAQAADGRSQPSEQISMGASSEQNIAKVIASTAASHTFIACSLTTKKERNHIDWERKEGGVWRRLEGIRYHQTTYKSESAAAVLSAIRISRPTTRDNGLYRCVLRGHSTVFALLTLTVYSPSMTPSAVDPEPAETPYECCSRQMVRQNCSSFCSTGTSRRRPVRPGGYLPQHECLDEMRNLMQCTIATVRSAPCCIYKKVPHQCLGMCDRAFPIQFPIHTCAMFFTEITQCQEDSFKIRPPIIQNVRLNTIADKTDIRWDPTNGATAYTLYYKRKGGSQWKHMMIQETKAQLTNIETVAIVANNGVGPSSPVRMIYDENEWILNLE